MKITKFKVNGQDSPVDESALAGKLLPVPEETDEGKMPIVVEGQYTLRTPATASGLLIVTFSGTTANGNAACDATWEQIEAANFNLLVYYYDTVQMNGTMYQLPFRMDVNPDGPKVLVAALATQFGDPAAGNYDSYMMCSISDDGSVTCVRTLPGLS